MVFKEKIRILLSRKYSIVILIFLLSFSIRLIYLQEIQTNPFFEKPIADSQWHDLWAKEIAQGNWLGETVFFRAPLYPYFLSAIYMFFGHSYYIPRLIQIILGSLSCVLIFCIAKILFNQTTGIIAALMASTYGIFVYFEGELLIPSLIVFLDLLLFFSLLINIKKRKPFLWFFSGVIFGLSAIARPNILLFFAGILIWIAIRKIRKKFVQVYLFLFLGAAVTILPVTLRNYLIGKDLVLISCQGGINFYIGNNPRADGKHAAAPSLEMAPEGYVDNVWVSSVKMAEKITRKKMKPSEVSNFWFQQAFQFFKKEPLKFILLQLRKLYYFWNAYEIESNKNIYMYRRFSVVFKLLIWICWLAFPFGLICPLSLVGIFLCRKNWRKMILLYLFIFLYMLSVIAFFVTARFRVPVLPFLIIFASHAICWFYKNIKISNYRNIISPFIIFVALLLISNSNFFNVRDTDLLREHFSLGYAYAENGLYNQAISEYRKALQCPYDSLYPLMRANVHHNLGLIYRQRGLFAEAEKEYLEAIKLNPQHSLAYCNLGTLYAVMGLEEKAERAYRQALKINPDYKAAKMNLEKLLQKNSSFP